MYEFTKEQIKDIDYFRANVSGFMKDESLRFKHVVISDGQIVNSFDGLDAAIKFAVENFKKGQYIIQHVVDENEIVNFI